MSVEYLLRKKTEVLLRKGAVFVWAKGTEREILFHVGRELKPPMDVAITRDHLTFTGSFHGRSLRVSVPWDQVLRVDVSPRPSGPGTPLAA